MPIMHAAVDHTTKPAGAKNPFRDYSASYIAGRFGMWLLLLALGMLFAASLVGFLVIRIQLADVWPADAIGMPPVLWLSTAVLLASSGTVHIARAAAARNEQTRCAWAMLATFVLGLAFLALQVIGWLDGLTQLRMVWADAEQYRFALTGFFVFSGLHGLHVVGGLIPMALVATRAFTGRYTAPKHAGVHYIAMYWHFLDAVWIVLFTTLLIGT